MDHSPANDSGAAVTLDEVKVFLRVYGDNQDATICALVHKATRMVRESVGFDLTSSSPAPVRLAVLLLTLRGFEKGDEAMTIQSVDPWIAPYRSEAA